MKNKLILLTILFTLTVGCTSFDKIMNSYKGKHIDDVSSVKGAPKSVLKRQNGGTTHTWESTRVNQYGTFVCRQTFVTDKKGIIISVNAGNQCPNHVYFYKK